jgi:hypothetical protein
MNFQKLQTLNNFQNQQTFKNLQKFNIKITEMQGNLFDSDVAVSLFIVWYIIKQFEGPVLMTRRCIIKKKNMPEFGKGRQSTIRPLASISRQVVQWLCVRPWRQRQQWRQGMWPLSSHTNRTNNILLSKNSNHNLNYLTTRLIWAKMVTDSNYDDGTWCSGPPLTRYTRRWRTYVWRWTIWQPERDN